MEEKERFEYYLVQNQLYDKTNDELYRFGIEQDKTRLVDFLNLMNEDWWALYIRNKELREENQQLKQQLAEKEKEIEDLKAQRRIYLNRSVEECNKITDLEFELQHKDQDKILFTLEQLEKVKKFFLEEHRDEEMDTDYIITKDAGEIADYILDQIKELNREVK